MAKIVHSIWRGTIAGGDIWQAGWHAQTDDTLQSACDKIATHSKTLFDAMFTGTVVPQSVRLEEIEESSGDLVGVANQVIVAPTQVGVIQLPSEVAACVTIRPVAGLTTGRFYLPSFLYSDVTTNGLMLPAKQTAVADKLQTFFQTNLGTLAQPIRLGIYSRKTHNFVGAGSIELGNVYDSQRRRRNKLIEARLTRSVL